MRLFNAQVLDESLEGANALAQPAHSWGCLLARAEALKLMCFVDSVSGSPSLTVKLTGSNADDVNYFEATKSPIVGPVSPGAGTTIYVGTYSSQDATFPPPRHLTLSASLDAGGGEAHVRIWVCGRGPQLLEAIAPSMRPFNDQLEMARMLADENRTSMKKKVLRPGASLFYPPDRFLPSLRWER